MAIVLETTIGDMTIDLYTEQRPTTCNNFLKLCKMKYYNFSLFYSVQNSFIAQTGDPTATGNGGDSVFSFIKGPQARYTLGEKRPRMKHNKPGLVSMVNCGDHLIGSQFFITLGSDLYSLDEHIIFGEITEGHEILRKLNETICDNQHRPYQDIRITHTVVLDDPFDEIDGLAYPPNSPEPTEEVLQSDRIGADEVIEDTSKFPEALVKEIKAEQEAKAQATILEIVGDIPDVDVAPPENVLFVCKLNPVTTDEDLEIIFSRFGKINSCEVIRDKISGDSLQYAFIEFDERKSCEDAYFKMDNVLIDDRRIHVDFSQSVSKMRWRGKGRGVEYFDNVKSEKNVNESKKSRRDDKRRHGEENYEQKSRHRSTDRTEYSRNKTKRRSKSRSKRERSRSRHRNRSRSNYRRKSKSARDERRRSRSRSRDYRRKYEKHPHRR